MLVPINWLDDYVDIKKENIQTLEDHLIMSGSNTEEVTNFSDRLENIVVGKIKKIEKHKDADKLLVMQVDIGKETLQIVTGAKNCSENDLVPVVLAGGKIFDGTVIKKGKLRGETSNGMLCSLQELGFDKSVVPEKYSNGIYILDDSFEVGQDFLKTVLDDNIVEFEITPNRPDCLSILGMAREASATFDKELNLPNTNIEDSIDYEDSFEINIEDKNKCRRYMAKI
ncbi:MAG: YtpR family tRNA-binding protein, partial [Bacillota bacterium]